MHQIDKVTGSQLMRLWGVPSWLTVNAQYFMWNGVGVFVVRELGNYVELHMAMKKEERKHCRKAVSEILSLIGNRNILAPIKFEHKQVCNLAKKFGFSEEYKGFVNYEDGTNGVLILMKRTAK